MIEFSTEQKILEIGGVKVGGQPGQLPTVLIGSMFYHGHKIVEDEAKGVFDAERARRLLDQERAQSQRTGNPRMTDVVGATPAAIVRYVEFIAEATDSPFLIDGTVPEVRMAGAEQASKLGLLDRAVYNSIMPGIKDDEIAAIRAAGIRSAILLTYSPQNPTLQGKIEVLDELLAAARSAGIVNCLIDGTVLDIPDPGPVAKLIHYVKDKHGLPAGCGAHNSIDRWHGSVKLPAGVYATASVVANTIPQAMGADFLLYGPVQNACKVYTATAVADAYIAYAARQQYGRGPLSKEHPLFLVFKRSNPPPAWDEH